MGSLREDLAESTEITLPSGRILNLEPTERRGNRIAINDFSPCLVILNNDFAGGVPKELQNLEQSLLPPLGLAWATRLKSSHFQHYQNVAHAFATEFDLDDWLLAPMFRFCGEINFKTREGVDCLVRHANTVLEGIKQKYHQYGIADRPFVIIKADAGTYGMAVMTIEDPEEIKQLNRKQRTQMAVAKGGLGVHKVIIQEGIHTVDHIGDSKATAEPVIYLIGNQVVGGFYRAHEARGSTDNLNAPGMQFAAFDIVNDPKTYAYCMSAQLANLAAGLELAEERNR